MIKNKNGVLAPEPKMMEKKLRTYPQLHDTEYTAKMFPNCDNPPLVLPDTGDNFRVVYTVYEYQPLLDSSNMTMDDWIRISLDVQHFYMNFDGFVILHGTDTMSYTASALSFMLENLGKSVIITGSQIPLFEPRSDGRENLLNALIIAGNYIIPEVTLLFNNKLFRGNRTTKHSASNMDAFSSPNLPPLATIGIKINVDWKAVVVPASIDKFRVHSMLSRNVGLLRLFPSITVEVVRAFLTPPIEGVILQTYGAGNGPTSRKDLLDEIRRATLRGIIIVNCSQCPNGRVEGVYETGNALVEAGVIPGSDMTPEAALAKLSYILSKKEWSLATKKEMMQTSLRGELTVVKETALKDLDLITAIAKTMNISSTEELEALKTTLVPSILCNVAAKGDCERLEVMRQFGAYLSACDYDYRTPLHIAASEGNVAMVEYLLKQGASVHMRDRDRKTPLLVAIDWDHHDVIDLLIRGGSHLSLPPETLAEAMNSAARKGDLRRLESYKRAGANLADRDAAGRSPSHAACENCQVDVLRYLLDHGFYSDATDVYGHTPKEIATILGYKDLVNLIEDGIRPDDERSLPESGLSVDHLERRFSDGASSISPRQSPTPRESVSGYFSSTPPMRPDSINSLLSTSPTRRSDSITNFLASSPTQRTGHLLLNGYVG
ncbi:L-asparaginase-like [Galendromus occidentalis]|uniref:asparaginase n=1 Tax=Galendromus occidentalis TaxID=34638 RepID=A0AAJ6QY00_9ACAR|nr:L-asparaginase-like [Galendromus occidentalis]